MSGPFRGCIIEAAAKGLIDKDAAQFAQDAYDEAHASHSEAFGPDEADRRAADAAIRAMEAERIEAQRRQALSVRARRRIVEGFGSLKEKRGYTGVRALGGGGDRPPRDGWVQGGVPPEKGKPYSKGALSALALKRLVENRPGLSGAPQASVAGRYRALRGRYDAMMADLIEKFETRTGLDAPNRADLDNIGREAFGESTGDAASKGLAEAWVAVRDLARKEFNAAGGQIGEIKNYGFPTRHDPILIRRMGKEGWIDAELPRLDRQGMIDRATGQPFTEKRLRATLGEVYDSIASGGASKRMPGEALGSGALWRTRSEARFLKYRSFDDWKASQQQFGQGDLYQVMMGHLDDMAVDIAQMEILGPNPARSFEWLTSFARREAALEQAAGVEGAVDRAEGLILEADRMLASFNGELNTPVNTRLAQIGGTVRAALTGNMLGSAIFGEVAGGPALGRMARDFTGLDRNGDMGQLVRLLVDPAERAMARRTGFIIETAMDGFVQASQDNLRLVTVGNRADGQMNALARRLPSATMRLQGLSGFVAARKRSHRFELMGALHDVRGQTLADLAGGDVRQQALGRWLAARGFTEKDWAVIRASAPEEPRPGVAFLSPLRVADRELALRLSEAIELETRLVSPESTLESRSFIVRERPGTIMGEVMRSLGMFKGFTATLTSLYAEEIALQAVARGGGRAGTAAPLTAALAARAVIFLTIGGAVGLQLREMAKGNDPRDMSDAKFWGAALTQGGGVGIFGDFLYAAEARNGRSSALTAFGPVGQAGADTWDLTGGDVLDVAGGLAEGNGLAEAAEDARIGRDASRYVTRYNPLASLWWSRATWSRMFGDNLQRALDPEAEADFARRRKRMERDMGQEQWWATGQTTPGRAPDLGAMLGAQE